jgi:hypothetical protein
MPFVRFTTRARPPKPIGEKVFRELFERGIGQKARGLICPAHEAPAIEKRTDDVKEVKRHGRARDRGLFHCCLLAILLTVGKQ